MKPSHLGALGISGILWLVMLAWTLSTDIQNNNYPFVTQRTREYKPDQFLAPPICGNKKLEQWEQCDLGIYCQWRNEKCNLDTCRCETIKYPPCWWGICPPSYWLSWIYTGTNNYCGDGIVNPWEQCEPSVFPQCENQWLCNSSCRCDFNIGSGGITTWQVGSWWSLTCWNGYRDAGEQCDPANPRPQCEGVWACTSNCECDFGIGSWWWTGNISELDLESTLELELKDGTKVLKNTVTNKWTTSSKFFRSNTYFFNPNGSSSESSSHIVLSPWESKDIYHHIDSRLKPVAHNQLCVYNNPWEPLDSDSNPCNRDQIKDIDSTPNGEDDEAKISR